MQLRCKRFGRCWWIVGDEDDGPYGPYDTKADAEVDRKGIMRTFENWDNHGYATTEKGE